MREQLRKLKTVIVLFAVLIFVCLVVLGCVFIFGSDGSSVGTAAVRDNVIGFLAGK